MKLFYIETLTKITYFNKSERKGIDDEKVSILNKNKNKGKRDIRIR